MANQKEQIKEVKQAKRQFSGVVVGLSGDKTISVRVDRVKIHPKYKKRYSVSHKYLVHDEAKKFKVGDQVQFVECRPISKSKRWRVIA